MLRSSSLTGRWQRALDILLVVAFLAAIVAPILVMIRRPPIGEAESPNGEEHLRLAGLLERAPSVFEKGHVLKTWFTTRFGFRDTLIETRARLHVNGLGISTSDLVLLGDDDWLFYIGEQGLESFRRSRPLSSAELLEWGHILDVWTAKCRKVGAQLVVMIPPDKATVYADLIPAWASFLSPKSRLDQVAELIAGRSEIDFVDVRPVFAALRRNGLPLYFHTDTHWNQLGAYAASRELARTLARRFPAVVVPPPIADASVFTLTHGGDLARFLGLRRRLHDEDVRFASEARRATLAVPPGGIVLRDMHIDPLLSSTRPGAPIPRAFIVRDSYGSAMIEHIAEYFGSAVYVWTTAVDPVRIESLRPNVVVIELVERTLMKTTADILEGK